MISGAVDDVAVLESGEVRLRGWATYTSDDDDHDAAEVRFSGPFVSINRTLRTEHSKTSLSGFELVLRHVDDLASYFYGAFKIDAFVGPLTSTLPLWPKIKARVIQIIVTATLKRASSSEISQIINSVVDLTRQTPQPKPPVYEEFLLSVGGESFDAEVSVGRNGMLFLLGGSNSVSNQYKPLDDDRRVREWHSLVSRRSAFCISKGVQFLQMIVPEKQSILPQYFPEKIDVPTALLRGVTKLLNGAEYYLDCADILAETFKSGVLPFRKVDSHLSFFGALRIVESLTSRLGLNLRLQPAVLEEVIMSGDLGQKFYRGSMGESVLMPDLHDWTFSQIKTELVLIQRPPQGNLGTICRWRSAESVSNQKVIIFGNSMFERGGGPLTLSWWASRIFRETLFIWSPAMNIEKIEEFGPDLVICQTVERFLPTLPAF